MDKAARRPRGSKVASHELAGCKLTRSLGTRSLATRSLVTRSLATRSLVTRLLASRLQVASSPGRWLASDLRELEAADWSFGKESLTSKVFFWKESCRSLLIWNKEIITCKH
ncbi:UNVERIFIED_CONTAM: hypothetical protein Slati_3732100 [Sesamum latifolium]|uniref:Uncharacterized protein n=1 Tax=Sesamum latifolium TaxID=2727402 RepID=A0AAW2U3L1_9LAMI